MVVVQTKMPRRRKRWSRIHEVFKFYQQNVLEEKPQFNIKMNTSVWLVSWLVSWLVG